MVRLATVPPSISNAPPSTVTAPTVPLFTSKVPPSTVTVDVVLSAPPATVTVPAVTVVVPLTLPGLMIWSRPDGFTAVRSPKTVPNTFRVPLTFVTRLSVTSDCKDTVCEGPTVTTPSTVRGPPSIPIFAWIEILPTTNPKLSTVTV